MENQNSKRFLAIKLFDIINRVKIIPKLYKSGQLKPSFCLRFLIGVEVLGLTYHLFKNYYKPLNTNIQSIEPVIWKENITDYLANILIYNTVGGLMYAISKPLFYKTVVVGSIISASNYFFEDKINDTINRKLNSENFKIFNNVNILPKLFLTTGFLGVLNYYALNKQYRISQKYFFMNRRFLIMFISTFIVAKLSRTIGKLSTEAINLNDINGIEAWLASYLLINPIFLPAFILCFYYNPFSLFLWTNPKNNMEESEVNAFYGNKTKTERMKAYVYYITMLSFSNSLNLYF